MTDEGFALHAWVDESMRVDPDLDQGTYILASVVCDPAGCEPVRAALRDLLTGKEPRLHWRDEDASRRTKIAAAVAAMDMAVVVVVGMPMAQKKQERARRICLETLLPELALIGVTRVFMEARTPSLMRKDRTHLTTMVGRKLIGPDLRVYNARPLEEPMLWVPDAVAGCCQRCPRRPGPVARPTAPHSHRAGGVDPLRISRAGPESAKAGSRHSGGGPGFTSHHP